MSKQNSQLVIKTLIDLLIKQSSNRQIADYFNKNSILSPQGKPYSIEIIDQELTKLRHPSPHFSSALYRALLLCITTGEVTLREVSTALFSPRKQAV